MGENKVSLDKEKGEIHIENLTISNPDTYKFLKDKENLKDWTIKALIIGCVGLKQMVLTENVDFVEKEFNNFIIKAKEAFEKQTTNLNEKIETTFSLENTQSPLFKMKELIDGYFNKDNGQIKNIIDETFNTDNKQSALSLLIEELKKNSEMDEKKLHDLLDSNKTDSPARQFKEQILEKLKKLGVTDSKQLTQKRREILAEKIKEKAETFEITITSPMEIERANEKGIKLNELEAIKTAIIINRINKGFKKIKVVVDCPSPNITKWTDYLKTKIDNLSNLEISCEHKADKNHVSVSAASILAKTVREIEMDKIKAKYGPQVGSGYTSDPLTIKFLEKHVHKHENDGIFRRTWGTFKRAKMKSGQGTLF